MAWSKYHSQKVVADGDVLKLLEKAGEITDLRRQVPFELLPDQREPDMIGPRGGRKKGRIIERKAVYIADFVYKDRSGREVVEDCKGMRTKDYIIKRKLILFRFGIRIKET